MEVLCYEFVKCLSTFTDVDLISDNRDGDQGSKLQGFSSEKPG